MNPVELIENQEIGPENAAHEISLFAHHRPALEGAVCIEKEALKGGGGVDRPKIERYEGPTRSVCQKAGGKTRLIRLLSRSWC